MNQKVASGAVALRIAVVAMLVVMAGCLSSPPEPEPESDPPAPPNLPDESPETDSCDRRAPGIGDQVSVAVATQASPRFYKASVDAEEFVVDLHGVVRPSFRVSVNATHYNAGGAVSNLPGFVGPRAEHWFATDAAEFLQWRLDGPRESGPGNFVLLRDYPDLAARHVPEYDRAALLAFSIIQMAHRLPSPTEYEIDWLAECRFSALWGTGPPASSSTASGGKVPSQSISTSPRLG